MPALLALLAVLVIEPYQLLCTGIPSVMRREMAMLTVDREAQFLGEGANVTQGGLDK